MAAPTATITGNSTDGYPVTGTAPANAAIEILNDDNEVVGSGTANGDGEYTITLTEGVSPAENLRVVAVVTAGGQEYRSPATTIVVPEDNAEDQTAAPTVAPWLLATTVSGTAEPGAEVTVELPSGDTVTVAANDEGEWTATVPTVSLDDVLTVTALADGKTESLPVTVTVQGLIVAAPTATISGNSADGYPVTGTAPANAIEILNADDRDY